MTCDLCQRSSAIYDLKQVCCGMRLVRSAAPNQERGKAMLESIARIAGEAQRQAVREGFRRELSQSQPIGPGAQSE